MISTRPYLENYELDLDVDLRMKQHEVAVNLPECEFLSGSEAGGRHWWNIKTSSGATVPVRSRTLSVIG